MRKQTQFFLIGAAIALAFIISKRNREAAPLEEIQVFDLGRRSI